MSHVGAGHDNNYAHDMAKACAHVGIIIVRAHNYCRQGAAAHWMPWRDRSAQLGKEMVETLKEELHRQVYQIVLQACVGSSVVARATISATRKDVTAKCYGGDINRKKKLLNKQKEGKKKRALQVGEVTIPQTALTAVLVPK